MRYFIVCFLACWMTACSAKDENYYSTHPEALQSALDACPAKSPKYLDCQTLEKLASRLNGYAYEVRTNPRAFGVEILNLQEEIAQQQARLDKSPKDQMLERELASNQKKLKEQLAIIRWLMSPGG